MISTKKNNYWIAFAVQIGLYLFVWCILSEMAVASLWFGIPTAVLAALVGTALLPSQTIVWYELFSFIPFFLSRSLLGGVDVAWRAFHPSMPIAPAFHSYATRLPPGLAQVLLANTISLLPGTLSATIEKGEIQVHVLDERNDFLAEIKAVERRLARLVGVTLEDKVNEE